jgi:hypothetical protein
MPRYKIGDETFHRKNLYLPCVISARVDEMTDEERVTVMKAAYWADNITNGEWPAVLQHDDFNPSARSRLKKKGAGWLIALARIAYINPKLFAEITVKAEEMYRDQIETDSFELQTLRNIAEATIKAIENGNETVHSTIQRVPTNEEENADG